MQTIAEPSDVSFLIIDDSVIEKQGKPKKIEGLGWHYSHSRGRVVYGHSIVSSHYRVGNISIPYGFEFYLNKETAKRSEKQFKSKPDIAGELVNDFKSFFNEKTYILTDSWYTSKKFINVCKSKDTEVIGALKSNRVFRFKEHGIKHKLSVYVKNLRNPSFENITFKGEAFKVRRIEVYLEGIGRVVVLISKRMKDRSKKYILCTDMSLSNEDIMKYYSYRWDIEVGYLYCKDRLGMGQYQMRNMKAIEKYCALIFSAFGLLEYLRVDNNGKSIGQSRRCFTIKRKKNYIDLVIDLSRKGMSKKDIYRKMNLVA